MREQILQPIDYEEFLMLESFNDEFCRLALQQLQIEFCAKSDGLLPDKKAFNEKVANLEFECVQELALRRLNSLRNSG